MGTSTSTSTHIYVPFKYPDTVLTGLFGYLPSILNMNTTITIPGFNGGTELPIIVNQTGNSYVGGNGANDISGIVLTTAPVSPGVQPIVFPSGETRLSFVYVNTALVSMSGPGTIYIWYTNLNTSSINKGTATLNVFIASGPPSAPRTPSTVPSANTNNPAAIAIQVAYIAPLYFDNTNQILCDASNPISQYDISFSAVSSPNRFGTQISTSARINNSKALTYPAAALFPYTTYQFQIAAKNSLNASFGPFSTNISGLSPQLIPVALPTPSFQSTYLNTRSPFSIATGNPISNLYTQTAAADMFTNLFVMPIHTAANQGSVNLSLATLSTSLNSTTGASVIFNGFGQSIPPTTSIINKTKITVNDVSDTYWANRTQACDGFYLQARNQVSVSSLVPGSSQQTLGITITRNGTPNTTSLPFYYDILPTTPVINNFAMTLGGAMSTRQISGVNILYGIPYYNVDISASNMGNYFYSSTLLTYTLSPIANQISETTLQNVSGSILSGGKYVLPSGQFSNPIRFIRTDVNDLEGTTSFTTNTYVTSVGASVVGYNIAGLSSSVATVSIPAIVDGPSYTLVNTEPATINTLSTTALRGMRIWSSAPPYTYGGSTLPTLPITATPYDHSQDIATGNYAGELQVVNGSIRTPTTGGYLDYTTYYYATSSKNTVNYSNISLELGYRYATFAWQLPIVSSPFNTIKFTFSNFMNLTVTPFTPITDTLSQKIYFYYMFVNSNNPSGYNSGNINILTSTWIDANTTGVPGLTSTNFNKTPTTTPFDANAAYVYNALNITSYNTNTLTIQPIIPQIKPLTATVTLVLRVGLAVSSDASFTSVNAEYT